MLWDKVKMSIFLYLFSVLQRIIILHKILHTYSFLFLQSNHRQIYFSLSVETVKENMLNHMDDSSNLT